MSNFWVDRLAAQTGRPAPHVQAQPIPQTAMQQAWWDTTPQQAPLDTQIPATQHVVLPGQPQAPSKAMSAKFKDVCPIESGGCGSANYMPIGNGWKCFECGYPVIQSASGIGVTNAPGQTAQPSRQIAGSGGLTNNFTPSAPGHIIAHL